MNVQIRMKSIQYRNSLRKQMLQAYFSSRRIEIRSVQRKKQEVQMLNQSVKQLVQTGNLEGLYHLLFKDKSMEKITILEEQNVLKLYELLSNNISQIHSILLIKPVIQLHYELIFLEPSRFEFNTQVVRTIYRHIFEGAHQILAQSNEENKKIINININGYLSCIYSFFLNIHQKKNQFAFEEPAQPQLLTQIFLCFNILYTSPIYIVVLSSAQIQYNCSQMAPCKDFILSHPQIVFKLVDQVNLNTKKNIALPSLLFLNSVIRVLLDNKEILAGFIPHYLSKLKIVYSSSNSPNPYFKAYNFYDLLQNTAMIFKRLSSEILNVHLGQIISDANFWNFCALLLGIETQEVRKSLFTIIKCTISNMIINNASLQNTIPNSIISSVIQELQSKNIEIVSENLDTLRLILRGVNQQEKTCHQYIQFMCQSGLNNILESIQSNKNAQIIQKALLLKKELEYYQNQNKMIEE